MYAIRSYYGYHPTQKHAHGKYVRPHVGLREAILLRRSEIFCAVAHGVLACLAAIYPGYAEINELKLAVFVYYNILRLYVPMDNRRHLPVQVFV